ncbi:GGDEF domain-containing protein [Demequina sp. NBRC 110057]|uniref:GGDEF domain-containing protein n=1 Tax=Demequina sp. NBRC 110057 TaxID=1570346 RepID=UPI0013564C22|nr:GGDEF domain-containing protein [Demequina sp. NBRC 110057]
MTTTPARARGTLTGIAVRVLDRRVGALTGAAGRAVGTTHAFLVFSLILTLSYAAFYLTYDIIGLGGLIVAHIFWVAGYVAGILLARLGRQLAAALLAFAVPMAQMVTATVFLGWEAGMHLYLLTAGQLVYVMFTERQAVWRWVTLAVALAAFLACQVGMPAGGALYAMPAALLQTLFSINALLTAFILFMAAALAHHRVEQARALADLSARRAEFLANTDALTGLATRRPVLERLATLAHHDGADFCLAIGDLDHFKALNDEHGHGCGDTVLENVGARLRTHLRLTDSVGRWGGEEFIFVLPESTLEDAATTMERVRSAVGDTPFACDGHEHRVTMSVGLTVGDHAGTPHHALIRADSALYDAKRKGRDQVATTMPAADAASEAPARQRRRDNG